MIHSNGSGEKRCFDSLIIECESVGKAPGHIFRDSDNERAMIGHEEEKIVEDSADEDLVFQSSTTDELLMSTMERTKCDTLTPSSPVMPVIGNHSEYNTIKATDSDCTTLQSALNGNSRSDNHSYLGSPASKSTETSADSTSATAAKSDSKRGKSLSYIHDYIYIE